MPQLHPSSLDFNKERFGERCHVHLRGHKKTLWTPAKTVEKWETSLIQVLSFLMENLEHSLSIFFRIQKIRSLGQLRQRTLLRSH